MKLLFYCCSWAYNTAIVGSTVCGIVIVGCLFTGLSLVLTSCRRAVWECAPPTVSCLLQTLGPLDNTGTDEVPPHLPHLSSELTCNCCCSLSFVAIATCGFLIFFIFVFLLLLLPLHLPLLLLLLLLPLLLSLLLSLLLLLLLFQVGRLQWEDPSNHLRGFAFLFFLFKLFYLACLYKGFRTEAGLYTQAPPPELSKYHAPVGNSLTFDLFGNVNL